MRNRIKPVVSTSKIGPSPGCQNYSSDSIRVVAGSKKRIDYDHQPNHNVFHPHFLDPFIVSCYNKDLQTIKLV